VDYNYSQPCLEGGEMRKPGIGDQEMDMLRFVIDHAPISVRETATRFGEPRNLARTTVLTVMERLREKGYLKREKADGIYQYTAAVPKAELMRHLVNEFVEKTLGGSLSPLALYLAQAQNITESELADLKKAVEALEADEEAGR
jgi:predicted transcriptional regulator